MPCTNLLFVSHQKSSPTSGIVGVVRGPPAHFRRKPLSLLPFVPSWVGHDSGSNHPPNDDNCFISTAKKKSDFLAFGLFFHLFSLILKYKVTAPSQRIQIKIQLWFYCKFYRF